MNKNFWVLVFLPLVICIVIISCDKDDECCDPTNPDCINYNPCLGLKEVSANFHVFESHFSYGKEWREYDTDTLWSIDAKFKALEDNAEYEWLIGEDTFYTQDVIIKNMPQSQLIPITLIVRKNPSLKCFPNDDGMDTITRVIYLIEELQISMAIEGKFRGFNTDSPNDIFEIEIDLNLGVNNSEHPVISGLPNNCGDVVYPNRTSIGYKQFYFGVSHESKCHFPMGLARIINDQIFINYTITPDTFQTNDNRIKKLFKGIKIL